jgi:hypothetical protein
VPEDTHHSLPRKTRSCRSQMFWFKEARKKAGIGARRPEKNARIHNRVSALALIPKEDGAVRVPRELSSALRKVFWHLGADEHHHASVEVALEALH